MLAGNTTISISLSIASVPALVELPQEEVRCTLQGLGLDSPLFVVDGCDHHYGDSIPAPSKYTAEACRAPSVAEVPRRQAERTVQDEIDAYVTAWEQGLFSLTTQEGPRPLCPPGRAPPVRVAPGMPKKDPPEHFYITVSRREETEYRSKAPKPPEPSVCVSAFGERFRLCAVIYQERNTRDSSCCFSCQALYDGCWHTYHSCTENKAEHGHRYDPNPIFERVTFDKKGRVRLDMEPVFFAYVRDDKYLPDEDYGLPDIDCRFMDAHQKVR